MSSFPRVFVSAAGLAVLLALAMAATGQERSPQAQPAAAESAKPEWSLNATAIEACSCPMFCQCYFNDEPADHSAHGGGHDGMGADGGSHFCLFNMAYKVNKGHHGDTDLAGAKFWISGDLGDNFSDGETEWALLRFDPSVTKEQREGLLAALPHLFPVKWKKFTVGEDAPIEWKADKDRAVARLDDGKAAEIILNAVKQRMTDEPVVVKNLVYWGAPRNDGFVLMKNERQGTRQTPEGVKPFEFTNSNGFMITVDINADDAAKAEAARAERPAGGGDGMGH